MVAFDTPVNREYLGKDGVYAPLADASTFAAMIGEMLQEPGRSREIGKRLRQRSRQLFSWEWAGRQISRVYESVLAGS